MEHKANTQAELVLTTSAITSDWLQISTPTQSGSFLCILRTIVVLPFGNGLSDEDEVKFHCGSDLCVLDGQ